MSEIQGNTREAMLAFSLFNLTTHPDTKGKLIDDPTVVEFLLRSMGSEDDVVVPIKMMIAETIARDKSAAEKMAKNKDLLGLLCHFAMHRDNDFHEPAIRALQNIIRTGNCKETLRRSAPGWAIRECPIPHLKEFRIELSRE